MFLLLTPQCQYLKIVSRVGQSVSIVSGYGLDDQAIEVRSPAEEKNLSPSLCVQTGFGAHSASCTMGTGGPVAGAKARPGCDAYLSPPSSAEFDRVGAIPPLPSSAFVACRGTALALLP
jgi:hypothetical protein